MLSRLLLLIGGVALTLGASVPAEESNREGKLFPVVQIVKFKNGPCSNAAGEQGSCYSQKECSNMNGASLGTCANGFGVCCSVTASCGNTVTANNTYVQNPGYPTGYSTAGNCQTQIVPPSDTCQIVFTMEVFDIMGTTTGDCGNDTFMVNGANNAGEVLCGMNAGQHVVHHIQGNDGPFSMVFTLSGMGYQRMWKILVTFLECGHPCLAFPGCYQFHKESSGVINSFNHGGLNPIMLNNLHYAICFAPMMGYCDVGISFSRFDFGNINENCRNDFISAGGVQLCGDFNTVTFSVNCTAGPSILYVSSDSVNEKLEEGFKGTFMAMAG